MPEQVPVQSTYDSVTEADARFSSVVDLYKVQPNEMDEFHSPNPVWTLYMVEEAPLKMAAALRADEFAELIKTADQQERLEERLAILNKLKLKDTTYNKVILASTGRTDEFAVGNVKITSYLADQGKTTNISLDIQVPQNADFYDHMFDSAKFLGIRRWDKVPMLLDLVIRGNDPYTGLPKQGPNKTFLVELITSKLRMDETGTHVEMDMRNLYDISHGKVYDLNEQMTITGKNPFEMLRDLMNKLRLRQAVSQLDRTKDIGDEFKLEYYPDNDDAAMNSMLFTSFDKDSEQGFDLSNTEGSGEDGVSWTDKELSVTYGRDTSVFEIIRNILLNSPYLINEIQTIADKNAEHDRNAALFRSVNAELSARREENQKIDIKQFFHMETQADVIDFDYRRNNYAVRLIYRVYIHRTPFGYASPGDIARNHLEDKRKIERINDDIGIYKKYDHLFTGKNQQVLNLDWNFDNLYFNQIAARNEEATHSTNKLNDVIQLQLQAVRRSVTQNRPIVDPIGPRFDEPASNLPTDGTPPAIRLGTDQALQNAYSILQPADGPQFASAPAANPRRALNYFAGDITDDRTPVVDISRAAGNQLANRHITAPLESGPKTGHAGITGPTDEGGNLLKRYFNSAWAGKHSQKTSDMITVQMTVRGDPFYLPDIFDDHQSLSNRVIKPSQPLMVMIQANQPAEYNDHGFAEIKRNNTLNAIYQVITVNHVWNENSWTCELDMRMEQGTDVNRLDFVEGNIGRTIEEENRQIAEAKRRGLFPDEAADSNEIEEEEETALPDNIIDISQLRGADIERDENLGLKVYLNLDLLASNPASALTADPIPDVADPLDAGQQAAINEQRDRNFPSDMRSITLALDENGELDQNLFAQNSNNRRVRFEFEDGNLVNTMFLEAGTPTPRPQKREANTRRIRLDPASVRTTSDLYGGPGVRVHEEFSIRTEGLARTFVKAPLGWTGYIVEKGHIWEFGPDHGGFPTDYRIDQNAPDFENIVAGATPRLDFFQ